MEWDEGYWIVDEGTFVMEKKVIPNLIEGEVKIIRLHVKEWPLKVNCVELEGNPGENGASICKSWETIIPSGRCPLPLQWIL